MDVKGPTRWSTAYETLKQGNVGQAIRTLWAGHTKVRERSSMGDHEAAVGEKKITESGESVSETPKKSYIPHHPLVGDKASVSNRRFLNIAVHRFSYKQEEAQSRAQTPAQAFINTFTKESTITEKNEALEKLFENKTIPNPLHGGNVVAGIFDELKLHKEYHMLTPSEQKNLRNSLVQHLDDQSKIHEKETTKSKYQVIGGLKIQRALQGDEFTGELKKFGELKEPK